MIDTSESEDFPEFVEIGTEDEKRKVEDLIFMGNAPT